MRKSCHGGGMPKTGTVPDAGQPVCSQAKNTHQQHQNSCSVLDVVVQFTSDPAQTEQPDHLKGAEQTADPLEEEKRQQTTKCKIFYNFYASTFSFQQIFVSTDPKIQQYFLFIW